MRESEEERLTRKLAELNVEFEATTKSFMTSIRIAVLRGTSNHCVPLINAKYVTRCEEYSSTCDELLTALITLRQQPSGE